MTPERWQQIDELLQETVKRPRRERAAFLDQVCADEAFRREVESLISFHDQAEDFLEVPAFEAAAGLLENQGESLIGLAVGPYRIESLLGAGGMGEVYLAEDTKLDRRVAIKFLPGYLEADEVAKRRLLREARAAAKLDHPNICATYEVGEDADRSFIVMQYVQGESLASRLQRQPLELRESLDVAIQVADALAEAHSHGIVHRDIKPHNIMITPRGQVKVLDFGLAKLVRSTGLAQSEVQPQSMLSAPGLVVGTAPYMSPEQAKGIESVDARSDLFSIGVVLYESIAGRLPFSGASTIEICSQVIHLNPPLPSQFNPHVPPALDALAIKALAKEPGARYQSASELLDDLRAVRLTQAEDQVLTKPIPFKPHTSNVRALTTLSNMLRRPRIMIPCALAALAIALILFFAVPIRHRSTPRLPPPEAMRWYNQGTGALRDGLYYKASNALQNAVDTSGEFALAHARLAEAMTELDYAEKASHEIIRARSLVRDLSVLPPLDALYLQALTYTASRDFEHAIESYQEIARQTQDSEKAYAYVDLGKAYEKDDQIDKAIDSYVKATELAPDDPAASLRLGILYSRKQNTQSAEVAFQKAQALYKALQNFEGVTEVLYQRGVASNNLGKLPEARVHLQEAFDMARDNKHQQIRILLQLSRAWYVGGKTARAQQYVADAIAAAQASGMANLSTQGLLELGKVLQYGRNYDEAEKCFNQALQSAQSHNGRRNEAMAELSLGSLRIGVHHDADGGLPFIERALKFYEPGGYRKEVSEALIQLARARCLKGEYDDALGAYEQVLEVAERIDNQSMVARAHADTGNLLNQQERYPEALGHLEKSFAIYTSLDNHLLAGYSLADRADALWRLGRYEEAREVLSYASAIVDQTDSNKWLIAKLSLIDAYLTLSERRFLEARGKAKKALTLNAGTEPEVDAMYALGLAQALSGKTREGRLSCEDAVAKARHLHDPQSLPNALLALAEVMLEEGNMPAALTTALDAQGMFAHAGRQESEWRAWLVAARATRNAANSATEREYLSRAGSLLAGLEGRWGTEAYNLYVTRPDVQYYRQQLGRALNVNN